MIQLPATVSGSLFIDGQWQPGSGDQWCRTSPAYQHDVWSGNWCTDQQVDAAISAATAAFGSWAETRLDDRLAICKRFATLVKERGEELALLIAVETGKPLWEARTEVAAVQAKVNNSATAIMQRRWTTTERQGDLLHVTRFRPHGVMIVLGPFNFPAHLPGAHIVPALLAGNTVVFKPSELTPATGQWLVQAWESAGLPSGVLNLVHGGAKVSTRAVENADIAGVLFTGSERVGRLIHRALAGRPEVILALELGGNNPLVVHGASDIESAARTVLQSAYITAGQRCTCARRLIAVGDATYTALIEELNRILPKVRIGLPLDEQQPFIGPLIDKASGQRMLVAQQALLQRGATAVVPMRLDDRCHSLLSPGLIAMDRAAAPDDCEYFGPMLTAEVASDLDEAIALANRTKFGLAAGLIGDSVEDFHYFLHRIHSGIVNWNRPTTGASGKLPFGGVGASGNHRPSGYFAADYCSYPVASIESHELDTGSGSLPGLEEVTQRAE